MKQWPPRYLLRNFVEVSFRQCSDPRDRVYAVRALLDVEDVPSLVPDYSLPAGEVYRRLTIALFEKLRELSQGSQDQPWAPLALIGTEDVAPRRQFDRPSWVPNFDTLTERTHSKIDSYAKFEWLRASQFLPAPNMSGWKNETPEELQLRAKVLAVIQEIFPGTEYPVLTETNSDLINEAELSFFSERDQRCLDKTGFQYHDQSVLGPVANFLTCGCHMPHLPNPDRENIDDAQDWSPHGHGRTIQIWSENISCRYTPIRTDRPTKHVPLLKSM